MRPLMVLGCSSNSGKSLLVTGLCRWFARQGVDVAPFKGQNMSNNARVVAGGEIGVAQWLQALAARVEPGVDMNPVLLKPEGDTKSQVIVKGVADSEVGAMPWRDRGPYLWEAMRSSYDALAARHDLIVLEGAGSPAEINLDDRVNNFMVAHADAAALLVADIDRGGAFAHIFGTWSLVPEATRSRLAGFVLNKFRGDASLLPPAPEMLERRTGMRHTGVLPMLAHELPDEEGATVRSEPGPGACVVAIVRYPYASNLDEWHLLSRAASVRWATSPVDLDGVDLVVLPGSKHVAADLAWMRSNGLDAAVASAAGRGTRVVGVCGGAMMLGRRIADPTGVEGGDTEGLGMIDVATRMARDKRTQAVTARFTVDAGPWACLDGLQAPGYEIRHGEMSGAATAAGIGTWVDGNVAASTIHGLFESPDVLEAVFGQRPEPVLDATFDLIADAIDAHLDTAYLRALVGC